jgi:hypothetical protein
LLWGHWIAFAILIIAFIAQSVYHGEFQRSSDERYLEPVLNSVIFENARFPRGRIFPFFAKSTSLFLSRSFLRRFSVESALFSTRLARRGCVLGFIFLNPLF